LAKIERFYPKPDYREILGLQLKMNFSWFVLL
jgi:hypothetical protein